MNWKMGTLGVVLMLGLAASAWGRITTITAEALDQMAMFHAKAPRLSMVGNFTPGGIADSSTLHLMSGSSMILRFSLQSLPKDHRILKAELTVNVVYIAGSPKLQVRRVLADWGTGVCHQYRRTFPKKEEWSQPGARGAGTDRAPKDTAVSPLKAREDVTIDVTEDVDLWYTGAAPNRGWIFTLENDQGVVYLPPPYNPHGATNQAWKLAITHEPK